MKKNVLANKKKIHFVGVGGIGMSGIASILAGLDYNVSGSDLETNNITGKLKAAGCSIHCGHRAENLPKGADLLVYSTSISSDNPELCEAKRRGIAIAHRAEVLGAIFNEKKGIAVTGTHGKTTTTSLISVMLDSAGLDPTVIIGGEVANFGGNARLGGGDYAVAEADESDSSFLHLEPYMAVLTNLEPEHLDHFKTLGRIKTAFGNFIGNIKRGGTLFYNYDDKNLKEIVRRYNVKKRSFGFDKKADFYPANIRMDKFETSFDCMRNGKLLGKARLKIPGRHNVANALAAIAVGTELKIEFTKIAKALAKFEGTKRRFQLRIDAGGVMLIDDYAHHPTEIRAVLDASRNWPLKRKVVVFQPHRYTRTKFLAADFGKAFGIADKLILTDIYAASEDPISGVSIKNIRDAVVANGLKDVIVLKKEKIADHVMRIKSSGDMVIVMGAGDIKKVADEICEKLKKGMSAKDWRRGLKSRVKGVVKFDEPLSKRTSFKIGGNAAAWFEPKDVSDLKRGLKFAKSHSVPFFVIGNGSNILASDDGFGGIVVSLSSPYFKKIKITGRSVRLGAGFSLPRLIRLSCEKGLAGLESLVGIPGTIGGAIFMNAGGSTNPIFGNIGNVVQSLKVIDYDGIVKMLKKDKLRFEYRRSNLDGYIIVEASLKFTAGDANRLLSSMLTFLKMKREKQVLDVPSAGCIFKNPPNSQFTCGQMIDMLGLKGARTGGAEISTRHANFIVNKGGARCADVMELAGLVRSKVAESYGVELEMEVKVL